jgi:RNA polymerase sigma factor (sigma-70 family)
VDDWTDYRLLEATRQGDALGFDRFYRRHCEVVVGYFAQRVRNPEAAADLMAETFTAALVAVHDQGRSLPTTPLAWLFTIAHRKLIDSYRRGRVQDEARRRLTLEPMVLDDEDIERIDEIAQRVDVAAELARALPRDQFEALRARVLDGLSYRDAARQLQCSEEVARKRVSRALNALRTAIGEVS